LAFTSNRHDCIMRQTLVFAALLGMSFGMPPQQRAIDGTNVRILNFESYQDGANFGHQLFQEDGTSSGQKRGPDGLQYGFYTYINPDNQRIKVYWRAGDGVGYEVIGAEGLAELGNLRAPSSAPLPQAQQPARLVTPAPRRPQNSFIPAARPTTPRPIPAQVGPKQPAKLRPNQHLPVVPDTALPTTTTTTSAPESRFDYPASINLERTATGFFSSLTATR